MCREWKEEHEYKVIVFFGLGSNRGDFAAPTGPSTDHPQTAGKCISPGAGIAGPHTQNEILKGLCGSSATEAICPTGQAN